MMLQLTHENYHSRETDLYYMSVSQFKEFDMRHGGCEARAVAKLQGEWEDEDKTHFIVGGYLHAWNQGPEHFRKYCQENYDSIYKKRGGMYAPFEQADRMINKLKNDELVTKVREGQKEVIMTAELFGVPWKIMIDIYNPAMKSFADIKTVRSIHEKLWNENTRTKQSFIEYYDYFLQMAVYAEVERINRQSDEYFAPHIIAVSKEDPPDIAVIYMGTDFIQDKLFEVEMKLPYIMMVKKGDVEPQRCERCEYCRATKRLTTIMHYSEL